MDQPNALTYVELFAGAGGMSLGLETAGWRCVAHAEIEPHARAVLRHHWPDVPLYGDVTELDGTQFKGVTMVTGGSPCQDLSIAGKRAGMTEGSGTRSSLFFEQVRIWNESEAPYILWENVYGAFSSNAGRDFAAVLSALVGAAVPVPSDGWVRAGVVAGPAGVAAWRTLDAQYFGVPQRRRRVFVLGARAGGVDPAEVFALAESLSGHLAASGEAGEGVATDAGRRIASESGAGWWDDSGLARLRSEGGGMPQNVVYATDAGRGAALAVNISNGVGRLEPVMGRLDADGASTTAIGAQTRGVVLSFQPGNIVRGEGPRPSTKTFPTLGAATQGDQAPHVLAFAQNTRDEVRVIPGDKVCALAAEPGMKQTNFDARGNGEGAVVSSLTGDHQNRVTDYTAIVLRNREGKPDAISFDNRPHISANGVTETLTTEGVRNPMSVVMRQREGKPGGWKGPLLSPERSLTLGTANDQVVFAAPVVGVPRRLTPVECERLMGWPDQHTAHGINEKGKVYALADTARYKLCGNGIASPVTAWIGFQMARLLTDDK